MAVLHVGDKIEDFLFSTPWEEGKRFLADTAGERVALFFLRYYGCTTCQLEIHNLIQDYPKFNAAGVKVYVVLQSRKSVIAEQLKREDIPFELILDPDQKLYQTYGIGSRDVNHISSERHKAKVQQAKTQGFTHGEYEGNELQLPATFIIGPGHIVEFAYYGQEGSDVPDHHLLIENATRLATAPRGPASLDRLTPRRLLDELAQTEEIALLDIREQGLFVLGHLLLAVPAPLWRLALVVERLVPRLTTRIILTDADGALLAEAAEKLYHLGYTEIAVLEGGNAAWQAEGYEVFIDENVPGKALGEVVEVTAHTPNIDVYELRRRQERGDPLVVVDGRTPEEFNRFSLPGAYSVPNGELAYRIRELAPDPDTLVVVNCAGRTRSIIGAQTLINAGVANPVVALKNGTMDWLLAGFTLESGQRTDLPEPGADNLLAARQGAQRLAQRAGVAAINPAQLAEFAADGERTLYQFDVRTREEYVAGHVPGFRWAPGGQLVQATDGFIGTRGARIVLADWDGVRAQSTAAWLVQLGGYEVYLYTPPSESVLETGSEPVRVRRDPRVPEAPWITARRTAALLRLQTAVVIDVDSSLAYTRQHIPSAKFIAPHRLEELLPQFPPHQQVIITSKDGILARLVAGELLRRKLPASAVLGGNQAWFDAGLPVEQGAQGVLTGEEDSRYGGYNVVDQQRRNRLFREYLAWEIGLVEQLGRPGAELTFSLI